MSFGLLDVGSLQLVLNMGCSQPVFVKSQGFVYLGLLADYNLQLVLTPNCLTSSSQAHKIPIHSFLELQNKHTKTQNWPRYHAISILTRWRRVVSLDYEPKYASTGCPWGPPPLSLWNDCLWIQRLVGSDCSLKSRKLELYSTFANCHPSIPPFGKSFLIH